MTEKGKRDEWFLVVRRRFKMESDQVHRRRNDLCPRSFSINFCCCSQIEMCRLSFGGKGNQGHARRFVEGLIHGGERRNAGNIAQALNGGPVRSLQAVISSGVWQDHQGCNAPTGVSGALAGTP